MDTTARTAGVLPTRLRRALDAMSNEQRKAIPLPHVGAKEIAKHDARERAMLEKAEGKYEGVYIV